MKRLLSWVFGENLGLRSIDGYAPPLSVENRTNIARFGIVQGVAIALIGFVGLVGATVVGGPTPPGLHPAWLLILLVFGAVVWGPFLVFAVRRFPVVGFSLLGVGSVALITAVAFTLGPTLSLCAGLAYVMLGTTTFVSYGRRAAFVWAAIIGFGYGTVVIWQKGNADPFTRWILVVGSVVVVGMTVAWLVDRVQELAQAERRASAEAQHARAAAEDAHAVTAELNRTLEHRVEAQVAEISALSRLRRFLSTPVADAVLSSDPEHLLEPHRREIAVFFCDLRGFTRFAASAQPEDVDRVLTAYFDLLGEMVGRYQATVGGFTGDGLMAFFNDPLPVTEPALKAVAMAVELRAPMEQLIAGWQRHGYELGFGVGIAFGFANIGTIGFEGRRDYTALGPVVNLAARLCAEAASGEILIDQRTGAACDGRVKVAEERSVSLKGYHDPVATYSITAVAAGHGEIVRP